MSEFTVKQRRYQQWLSTPKHAREIATQERFAKKLGVSSRTLQRWQELPGFLAAVNDIAIRALHPFTTEVLHSIGQQAAMGSFKHQKLLLQLVGLIDSRGMPTAAGSGETHIRLVWADESPADEIRKKLGIASSSRINSSQ